MKLIGIVTVAGLMLLYFMDAAFKLDLMNLEVIIHTPTPQTGNGCTGSPARLLAITSAR